MRVQHNKIEKARTFTVPITKSSLPLFVLTYLSAGKVTEKTDPLFFYLIALQSSRSSACFEKGSVAKIPSGRHEQ